VGFDLVMPVDVPVHRLELVLFLFVDAVEAFQFALRRVGSMLVRLYPSPSVTLG
jgi:hypothetical protein